MMHHCCSSQGNMVGPCSCGLFYNQTNPFSMFSKPYSYDEQQNHDVCYSPYASSSVDCTLSLGTPSTRLSEDDDKRGSRRNNNGSCVSNYCWDFLQNKHGSAAPHKSMSRASGSNSNYNSAANDSPLARRCANCYTTSTPLWRNGPRGPKSLCNACGIRFKKEERRASASMNNPSVGMGSMEQQQAWSYNHSQTQKMPCYSSAYGNEFRFIEDDIGNSDSTTTYPYLSWRLNVADRPASRVHEFTR